MPDSTSPIAWIDVETSGLDPASCDLLEIAAVVTTGPDYTPVDEGVSVTIHPQRFAHLSPVGAVAATKKGIRASAKPSVADRVIAMHEQSGLFDDIEADRTVSLEEADKLIQEYLKSHVPPRGAIMGGNSITLDRNFLEAFAPNTFNHLHYRSLDCTSVYELVRRLPGVGEDYALEVEKDGTEHRGMSDIMTSIKQARVLSELLAERVPTTA